MKKSLPNVYLVALSVVVLFSLVFGSLLYWDSYFKARLFPQKDNLEKRSLEAIFNQRIKQEESHQAQLAEVELFFSPETEVFQKGEEMEIAVVLNSRNKDIWGADLRVGFDPSRLEIRQAAVGDYFKNPLVLENLVKKDKGEVWFSVGSLNAESGEKSLATLKIVPLVEKQASLSFLPETQVSVKGHEQPAIIKKESLTIF